VELAGVEQAEDLHWPHISEERKGRKKHAPSESRATTSRTCITRSR
jgi:hypothetical protein